MKLKGQKKKNRSEELVVLILLQSDFNYAC